jgi:hypothetical protein
MDSDREIIKNLFKDIYNLQIRYLYIPLDDYLWEWFVKQSEEIRDKYKTYGPEIDNLCRDMIVALMSYKEKKNGNKKKTDQRNEIQEAGATGTQSSIWLHDQ